MGRPRRAAEGGYVYHVLNRANARMQIFDDVEDYEAFEALLTQAVERTKTRLLAYCLMPNHWHLVVWPRTDDELSRFVGWLTLTHTQRWHAHRQSAGSGHVYQGRFKSFPVQADAHFYSVVRYVERNPLRARLVRKAQQWRWTSLYRRLHGAGAEKKLLSTWPMRRPSDWTELVNSPQTPAELEAMHHSIQRGSPFGEPSWIQATVDRLGLESTLRPRGRPKNPEKGS